MTEWILIILVTGAPTGANPAVTLATVPGWPTQAACESARAAVAPLVARTLKDLRAVCVPRDGRRS